MPCKTWIQPVYMKRLPYLPAIMILLILLIASSCKYEPTAVNFVDVDTVNTNRITIDFNNSRDTIVVANSDIYIDFAQKDKRGIKVRAWIDDGRVVSGVASNNRNDTGQIVVYTGYSSNLSAGTHKLRVEVYGYSGTGSYADKNNTEEKLLLSRTWTLIKIYDWVVPKVTSVTEYKGYAKVSWEKCNSLYGFINYTIVRADGQYYSYMDMDTVAIVDDISKCEAIDSNYVGGNCRYIVYTHISNVWQPLQGYIDIKSVLPDFSVKLHGDVLSVKWSKTPFYNSCKGYKLFYYDQSNSLHESNYISNVNDTMFSINDANPGDRITLYIAYVSERLAGETYIERYKANSISKIVVAGDSSFSYNSIYAPHSDENLYYMNNYNVFYKFNTSLQKTTDSTGTNYYQCTVSPKGRFIVFSSYGNISLYKDGKIGQPDKFYMSELGNSYYLQAVSDNGIALYNGNSYLSVVDFNSKKVIYKINDPVFNNKLMVISTDGKFFWVKGDNNAYSYDGSNIKKLWTGSKDIIYAEYMPDYPDKIIVVEPNSIQVRNSEDGTVVKSFKADALERVLNIDFAKGQMLAYKARKLLIISIADGNIEQEFVSPTYINIYDPNPYILKGGKIYCKTGYKFDTGV